jgi:hypothetical protein
MAAMAWEKSEKWHTSLERRARGARIKKAAAQQAREKAAAADNHVIARAMQ